MKFILLKTAFRLLSLLPLRLLHGMGSGLGWLIYWASAQYSARTRENLRMAGLASNEVEYRELLHATIAETGKSFMELSWLWLRPYAEVLGKVHEFTGQAHITSAQQRGKGIIFLTPHLGCFEICALYLAQLKPLTVMYRPPKLLWLDEFMKRGRERGQITLAKTDVSGVRLMVKALKRGEAIGLLPDQAPGAGEGEWADFFGRPAYTMTLLGRLAERSDAAVLMVYSRRLPQGQGYVINIEPLLLDLAASVPRQVNAALEQTIRTSPSQYLWSYNRYKTPQGVHMPAQDSARQDQA